MWLNDAEIKDPRRLLLVGVVERSPRVLSPPYSTSVHMMLQLGWRRPPPDHNAATEVVSRKRNEGKNFAAARLKIYNVYNGFFKVSEDRRDSIKNLEWDLRIFVIQRKIWINDWMRPTRISNETQEAQIRALTCQKLQKYSDVFDSIRV